MPCLMPAWQHHFTASLFGFGVSSIAPKAEPGDLDALLDAFVPEILALT